MRYGRIARAGCDARRAQFNVRYLEIRDGALPDYQLAAAIRRDADNVVLGRFLEVARQVASR
jgi:hypothetical protein